MAAANQYPAGSFAPRYMPSPQDGKTDEFINNHPHPAVIQIPEKTVLVVESESSSMIPTSQSFQALPAIHSEAAHESDSSLNRQGFSQRFPILAFAARFSAVVVIIGFPLALPVIITGRLLANGSNDYSQTLVYSLFLWLLYSWIIACAFNLFWRAFPYLFWWIASFVNPAHQKYWRVFRTLTLPVTLLGATIFCWVVFSGLINLNPAIHTDNDATHWDDVLQDILFTAVMWSALYLVGKILLLYISIHYHYRSDQSRITRSKQMQRALATLYEASVYLYPAFHGPFAAEDAIIRNSTSSGKATIRTNVEESLQKLGIVVGNVVSSNENSRWFRPDSAYAIVSRALDHPKSAAALATRIWMSIVTEGKEALVVDDIAEVLGPHRREEAEECFKALDENDNKDIHLQEMILSAIDIGRVRHTVYKGIHEMNHTINTFDWISVATVDFIMIFFILFKWVPQVGSLKEIVGFATLGLGFAIGRTVHEFLSGCIFIFFKHAYDLGDRVDIYNLASTSIEPVVVSHITILYTLFTCISDGSVLQISNDRLALKDVKNITRSGANKEKISVFVDFTTTFKDIQLLRSQLQNFLLSKDGARDYLPDVDVRVLSIHDSSKLELKVAFTHKSNWSDERLRAARSSKFMCALVAAIRKVPLIRPLGTIMPVGDETRPNVVIHLSDEDAAKKASAAVQKKLEKRMDYVKPAPSTESPSDTTLPEIRIEDEESRKKAAEEEAKAEKAKQAAADKAAEAAAAKAAEEEAYTALTAIPVGTASKAGALSDGLGRGTGAELEGLGSLGRATTGIRRKPAAREQSPYYNQF